MSSRHPCDMRGPICLLKRSRALRAIHRSINPVLIRLRSVHRNSSTVRRDRCTDHLENAVDIKPIKTNRDYRATLKQIEELMTAKANTEEGDRLDVLVTLVEAYERLHFPMELPDAVDAIKFKMEQSALTVEDLEPVIGRRNRVYEVLSRRRPLTLRMIEGLHTK